MGISLDYLDSEEALKKTNSFSALNDDKDKDHLALNYVYRVREAVAKLLVMFNQISEREQTHKKELKNRYITSNKESGNLQKELGDRGLKFAAIGLALTIFHSRMSEGTAKETVDFFAKKGYEAILGMMNTGTQATQKEKDAVANLANTDLSAAVNKQSDPSKQEWINILKELGENNKRAAQIQ